MKNKFLKTLKTFIIITAITVSVVPAASYSTGNYPTPEEVEQQTQLILEMREAGYTDAQIIDEYNEIFNHVNGGNGTGGRDGLLLDGSPAPNTPGNAGGSTGNSTTPVATPKPTCNHNYTSEVIVEATCANEGKITYTCSLCGKSYSESIPKEEHKFVIKEEAKGTCVSVGYRIEECSGCGEQLTIEGLYGNHALVEHTDAKEPTCLEGGYKTDLCTICGVIITTDLPALDHEWETKPTVDKEPTCTSEGSQSYHCTRCDETKDEAVVEALGHDIKVDEAPATLFGNGYYKEYCDRCDRVFTDEARMSTVATYRVPLLIGSVLFGAVVGVAVYLIVRKKKKKKK